MASFRRDIAGSADGNMKVWTYSVWFKRAKLGQLQFLLSWGENNGSECKCYIDSDDKLFFMNDGVNGSSNKTTRVLRDTNAWYHLVWRHKADEASNDDRWKIYLNGELIPASEYGSPTLTNADGSAQRYSTLDNWIGENARNQQGSGIYPFYGCMSHIHLCDGYAYDASDFGETDSTTGEWKIITEPSVQYGTYGYFIAKNGNSGTDQSPNTNNATVSGTITKTEDCPSNVFATLNPLLTHAAHGYSLTYGLGNNKITFNEPSTWTYITSTTAGINGKFYAEFKVDAVGSEASIGVIASDTVSANQTSGGLNDYLGKETDSIGYLNDGRTFKNNSAQQTGLTAISAGNILGVALDTENNTCQFYINGSSSGNPVSLTADKFYHFGVSGYNGTQISCNFGNGYFGTTAVSSAGTNASNNGIFEYDVPTGFTALSTKGLNL